MDADAKLDAALGWQAGVPLDHAILYFDGTTHGVDYAAEFNETSVTGALHYAPVMDGDGRIDQVAPQRPESRQGSILVRAGKPAVADHVGGENRGELPSFGHEFPLPQSVARR